MTGTAPAPARPLGADELRLWLVVPRSVPAAMLEVCTPAEHRRLTTGPDPAKTRDRLATRAAVRHLLAACTGVAPERVELAVSGTGKPWWPGRGRPRFSVAHTDGLAAVALSWREVGVDLERCRADLDVGAAARYSFSTAERSVLSALPERERRARFYRAWCRKEAYLKGTGTGWDLPLNHVPDALSDAGVAGGRLDVAGVRGPWQVVDVVTAPDVACAVAAAGRGWPAPVPRLFPLDPAPADIGPTPSTTRTVHHHRKEST